MFQLLREQAVEVSDLGYEEPPSFLELCEIPIEARGLPDPLVLGEDFFVKGVHFLLLSLNLEVFCLGLLHFFNRLRLLLQSLETTLCEVLDLLHVGA